MTYIPTLEGRAVSAPAIRPAEEADLPLLIRTFGRADLYRAWLAEQCAGDGTLLTAWLGGELIGSVHLSLLPAREPEIRRALPGVPLLFRLFVVEAHRGRKVGSALVAEAERRLDLLGYRRVALGVAVDNRRARRLYERLGYVEWEHPVIALPGETFTVLVKSL